MFSRFLLPSCLVFASACLAANSAKQAGETKPASQFTEASMQPFVVNWPAAGESLADVSFLLPKPAGKDGFIRAKDGHLVTPDGERFRIWGINATGQATVPPKEDAPILAEHLARRGINCIRFHFLDRQAPAGLVDAGRDDTRKLDPNQLDKLDFFIAELRKRGIYANLNLNVGRTYKAGDGVRDYELLNFPKALTYFDERLIELQMEYASQLLLHLNPYTGKAYRDEPAVAIVEFVNENSLVEAWFSGRLLGRQTNRPSGTWNDIPPSYAEALTKKYNAWLKGHLTREVYALFQAEAGVSTNSPVPRLRPDQFKDASVKRFRAEAAFYMEVEQRFFAMMTRYLRNNLSVKPLLVGNSDHGHGRSGYPIVDGTSLLDVVDGHVYWQHPNYLSDARGRRSGFSIANTPMVDEPFRSTPIQLSRTAMARKPYTVSEVNHPFPSEFACEGIPILATYGALQDWDGIFWYTLGHGNVLGLEPVVGGHFDFAKDPVKMTQLAAGALMFLRPDVRPAFRTVGRSYAREQVYDSIRLPSSEQPYFTPGFPLSLPLQHAVRVTSFDGPPTGQFEAAQVSPILSDTGELTWTFGAKKSGFVTVNTPRSQALVGYFGGAGNATDNLAAEVNPKFCALTLNALDDKPIAKSSRLLLTTTARAANSGMTWNEKRNSLTSWGKAPTLIEPVTGQVTLKNLQSAHSVTAQPLDGAGRPLGAAILAKQDSEGCTLAIGEPATTWFVISVAR